MSTVKLIKIKGDKMGQQQDNTERNRLADVFKGHPVTLGPNPSPLMTGFAQEIAEKVLAAGYRRTVSEHEYQEQFQEPADTLAVGDTSLTILEFLEARITEDEALARAATPSPWTLYNRGVGWEIPEIPEAHDGLTFYKADAHYVAHNEPARVLAECAAKRAILAFDGDKQIWEPRWHTADTDAGAFIRGGPKDPQARHVTRILAAVYKDHPDYQEDWAL